LTTLFGSLLGFSITAISIVIGYASSDKLAIVRNGKHYQDLWNVFKSAMIVLALATIFALLGLIFDRNPDPINYFLYINIFTIILAFFRVARCIWVMNNIISIVSKP
jgi:NhaP-type Na+/H+ or K+/H+ antiporter